MYDAAGTGRWGEISYDALGRRVQMIDDLRGATTDYYYDGDSEIVESNSGQERYYVHGLSYPDEHIQMWDGYVSEHPYSMGL